MFSGIPSNAVKFIFLLASPCLYTFGNCVHCDSARDPLDLHLANNIQTVYIIMHWNCTVHGRSGKKNQKKNIINSKPLT